MAYGRDRPTSLGSGAHVLGTVLEYDSSRPDDRGPGWKAPVAAVLLAAAAISFVYARFLSPDSKPVDVPRNAVETPAARQAPPQPAVEPPDGVTNLSPETVSIRNVGDESLRPPRVRALLQRLADAERQGKESIVADTIEKLRRDPSVADIDDKLARRLGELNTKRLFSGEPSPWVAETTARIGHTVYRIAREHATTVAGVRMLNGLAAGEEPEQGRVLRVLEFQRAVLAVHKKMNYADLTLNGKFFKRYSVSARSTAKPGNYPVTSKSDEGPRSRFSALGLRMIPDDMKELDMFLAPGATIAVSEM